MLILAFIAGAVFGIASLLCVLTVWAIWVTPLDREPEADGAA